MTMDNKEKTTQAIFNYLRSNTFTYSLKGLPDSKNPLEDFLFRDKIRELRILCTLLWQLCCVLTGFRQDL